MKNHQELDSTSDLNRIRKSLYDYLALQDRTSKQVRDNLIKKKFDIALVNQVIQEFQDNGLINDQAFALRYVERQFQSKPRGRKMIQLELKRLGIRDEFIRHALDTVDFNEFEMACEWLKKRKIYKLNVEQSEKWKLNAYRWLLSKGFSSETAASAVKYMLVLTITSY